MEEEAALPVLPWRWWSWSSAVVAAGRRPRKSSSMTGARDAMAVAAGRREVAIAGVGSC